MHRTKLRNGIDWAAVYGRLRAAERSVQESVTPNAERMEAAYRKRAANLARVENQDATRSLALPVLVFRLNQERYAIEVRHLAEVVALGYYAEVPRTPAQFLGVIGLRGELRVVLDLGRVLTPSSEAGSPSGFVLMLRAGAGSQQMGLKVDALDELGQIRPEELTGALPGSCIAGLASGALPVLDVAAVLARVNSNFESNRESLKQ